MEQMMERLVVAIGGLEALIRNKAKIGVERKTNQEEMKEEMKAQVGSLASHIDANQEKTDSNLKEIIAEMRTWRKETTAYQDGTAACLECKEPTSVEIRVPSCA
jgi:hypothetical protein